MTEPPPAGDQAVPLPDEAVAGVMDILSVHRWKSMGVASVECECGAIVTGDASLTQFPADKEFRRHIATKILDAARETQRRFWAAGFEAGRADQREADARLAEQVDARYEQRKSCNCGRVHPGTGQPCTYTVGPPQPFADRLRQDSPAATGGTE